MSERFAKSGHCLRHDEVACPSCITYERNDWRTIATRRAEALKAAEEALSTLFVHEQTLARDGRDPSWLPEDEAMVRATLAKVRAALREEP